MNAPTAKLRIDKWLWAARFFKTRSLAKKAVEGGKVHCNGDRIKVSKEVVVGDTLSIRQGWDEKTVTVLELSDQRRGAPIASTLYEETPQSIEKRLLAAEQRRSHGGGILAPETRPNKKQRRQLDKFRSQ